METEPHSPPRDRFTALWYRLVYAWDRLLKTGNRRAEYEHKYGDKGDYFEYRTRPYELKKYRDTLDVVLRQRRDRGSVLETGCSVGVFTKMLAEHFDLVVASDISDQALRLASETVGPAPHVTYLRGKVESLEINRNFDVLMVAEVLLFVRERDSEKLLAMLDKHLSDDGIIVEVANANRPTDDKFFYNWDQVIASRFAIVSRERHEDPVWPYEIVVYERAKP